MKNSGSEKSKVSAEEMEKIIEELLSPSPVTSLKELDSLIKPLPVFIGPGEWLKLLK